MDLPSHSVFDPSPTEEAAGGYHDYHDSDSAVDFATTNAVTPLNTFQGSETEQLTQTPSQSETQSNSEESGYNFSLEDEFGMYPTVGENQANENIEQPSSPVQRRSSRNRPTREHWKQTPYTPEDFRIRQTVPPAVAESNLVENVDQTPLAQVLTAAANVLDPINFEHAMKSPEKDKWLEAATDEYTSLIDNHTWDLVDLPPGRKAIEGKWIFRKKYSSDGQVERFKARFVVRGFKQQAGVDYVEHKLFSPVVRVQTIRYLLALSAELDYKLEHMDVCTTFLNGDLSKDVYIQQPQGVIDQQHPNKVCKLKKSIYGLKQSAKKWFDKIDRVLLACGFKRSISDNNLYILTNEFGVVILALYVDDLVLSASSVQGLEKVKLRLESEFKMKRLGALSYCLGVQVIRNRKQGTVTITQSKYVEDILEKFNLSAAKPVGTLLAANEKLSTNDQPTTELEKAEMSTVPYKSAVGCLIYLNVWTRYDIAKATQAVAQHLQNPGKSHWSAVKRVYRYLAGTKYHGIIYRKSGKGRLELIGWSDADWAADVDNRRRIAAYVFTVGGVAITWLCKLLPTVCLSSTESEYSALTRAGKEAISARYSLSDLNQDVSKPTSIMCDNQSAIALTQNTKFHARTCHIEVAHHFIRDLVATAQVRIEYVQTKNNLADLLTKGLTRDRHNMLMTRLGLADCKQAILGARLKKADTLDVRVSV